MSASGEVEVKPDKFKVPNQPGLREITNKLAVETCQNHCKCGVDDGW
jgi:hypothetical protein